MQPSDIANDLSSVVTNAKRRVRRYEVLNLFLPPWGNDMKPEVKKVQLFSELGSAVEALTKTPVNEMSWGVLRAQTGARRRKQHMHLARHDSIVSINRGDGRDLVGETLEWRSPTGYKTCQLG